MHVRLLPVILWTALLPAHASAQSIGDGDFQTAKFLSGPGLTDRPFLPPLCASARLRRRWSTTASAAPGLW
jgi:hypothetical protein